MARMEGNMKRKRTHTMQVCYTQGHEGGGFTINIPTHPSLNLDFIGDKDKIPPKKPNNSR